MDITPAIPNDKKLIESYGQGRFRISGVLYEQAVMVVGNHVLPMNAAHMNEISLATLRPLLDQGDKPELILLGTGAKQVFASKELKQACREVGVQLETMSSDAACRTYNVLLAESRPVAVALLPL